MVFALCAQYFASGHFVNVPTAADEFGICKEVGSWRAARSLWVHTRPECEELCLTDHSCTAYEWSITAKDSLGNSRCECGTDRVQAGRECGLAPRSTA